MKLPLAQRKEIAAGTLEVAFDIGSREFHFQAGQYIQVTLPRLFYNDERGKSRNFSIASSPKDKKLLRIAFRVSESGFKRTLGEMALGSEVEIDGPFGDMVLPKDYSLPVVFVAGGIGITPFLSMLHFASEEKLPYDITLFYANKDKDSAAYLGELEDLTQQNPNFVLRNHFGLIDAQALQKNIDEAKIKISSWYVVGPPAMAVATVKIIQGFGVEQGKVRFTEFGGYPVPATAQEGVSIETIPRLSESVLRALDKNVLVSVTDLQGAIIYANDKFVEISKYSRNELMGQNHRILKSGFHSAQFYEELWHTISSGQAWRGEIKNRAKDDSFYWVDANIAPIFTKDNKVLGYIAIRFPITERKELEEKTGELNKGMVNLLEDISEEKTISENRAKDLQKFQQAVENTSQHIIITDIDGVVLYANPAVESTTGYTPAEVLGNKPSLWGRQMPQEFYIGLWRTIKYEKKSFIGELRNKRKNGEVYTVFANISPVVSPAGEVKFFIGLETDISKQKESEERERQRAKELESAMEQAERFGAIADNERALYLLLLSSIGEGVFALDLDRKITLVNKTAQGILGYSKEELVGKRFDAALKFIHRKDKTPLENSFWEGAYQEKKARVLPRDISVITKSGAAIPIADVVAPVIDTHTQKLTGLIVTFRDVREERALEEARLGFISTASHQLRTPLTSMRWFLEMLTAGDAGAINKTQAEFVDRVYQGTGRMISLINLLLQIARVEAGRVKVEPVPLNFKNIIHEVMLVLNLPNGKSQRVRVTAVPDPFPQIPMDKEVIWQVFQNLISNANRYSPKKSVIEISMTKKDDVAEFAVKDKGIGIPKDQQHRIFEKFFRADNALKFAPEGSGLGLSLVKALVEGWGGKIWFESEEGKGTTFYFTVPLAGMKLKDGEVTLSV